MPGPAHVVLRRAYEKGPPELVSGDPFRWPARPQARRSPHL